MRDVLIATLVMAFVGWPTLWAYMQWFKGVRQRPWDSCTKVQLRNDSVERTMGRLWDSRVIYDAWGAPYARSHDGSWIRLESNGETGDYHLYGTEWKHVSGPAVTFSRTTEGADG